MMVYLIVKYAAHCHCQIDFIRSLMKMPFVFVYNSESKAVTSIEICHESSPSKKIPRVTKSRVSRRLVLSVLISNITNSNVTNSF